MGAQLTSLRETSIFPVDETADFDRQDFRWILAMRVAASPSFANAPLLAKFLLYVCDRTLADRTEDLTERNIGIVVFQRRPDYKPSEDNIVRSYVRQLRQRLGRYFEECGTHESWRIVIPRGGYSAVFERKPENESLAGADISSDSGLVPRQEPTLASEPVVPRRPSDETSATLVRKRHFPVKIAGTAFICLLLGALLGVFTGPWCRAYFGRPPAAHPIWSELFSSSLPTYVVTADSSLAAVEELSGIHATLQQYIDGSYFAQFEKSDTPAEQRLYRLSREHMTGVPDANATAGIMELPEVRGKHVEVRNARALAVDDLKDANLILLGSSYSTPWVTLFEPRMNFVGDFGGDVYTSRFVNKNPQRGESPYYINSSTAPPYSTYAVLAFLPNLSGTGRALLVEGLTTAGTEAAAGFLLQGNIVAFLKTVPRDHEGHVRPFELLLKTTNLDSSASSVEIVAKRIY